MANWTADHRHLAAVGIPPSAMVADARAIAAVYAPGTFELPGHGFSGAASLTGAAERVRFAGSNVNGVVLDSAISPTTYYDVGVAPDDPDFFIVSLSGVPLVLVGDNVGLPFVIWNVRAAIDLVMAYWSSYVISAAKAYAGPWDPAHVPAWAPLLVAQLAAPTVCKILRIASARFEVPDAQADYDRAQKRLDLLSEGVPFDDGSGAFDATSTADNAAFAAADHSPTHWRTGAL